MARKASKSADSSLKSAVVAFKVEEKLAELLNQLPNKSDFIRKAIVAQLGMACPLCHGSGVVPRGLHDHLAPVIQNLLHRACDSCGHEMDLPREPGDLLPDDRARLEQFFLGGPLYCDTCYVKAPACGECGWHIDAQRSAEHQRVAHHE